MGKRHFKAKVCLVGEGGVGKTSLIRRHVDNRFDDSYLMTLGVKVSKKVVEVPVPNEAEPISLDLSIWDVMGQPKFRELLQDAYFTGVGGIIAVADLTRPETLDALYEWIDRVDKVTTQAPVVVAGNKADMKERVKVDASRIAALAAAFQAEWFLTSAKTGVHVEDAFRVLAGRMIDRALRKSAAAPAKA